MCAFSFTVFLSAFQLLPVAPYRILSLGGTAAVAGLFLGFLTYSSAGTAPLTGALVDRFGPRQVLIVASLAITGFSLVYAVLPTYPLMLGLVIVHGFFWSGLLSSSATYVTALVPATRRAEGMGYGGSPPCSPSRWRRPSGCGSTATVDGRPCASKRQR